MKLRVASVSEGKGKVVVSPSVGAIAFEKSSLGSEKIKPGDEIEVDLSPEQAQRLAEGQEVQGTFKGKLQGASGAAAKPRKNDF